MFKLPIIMSWHGKFNKQKKKLWKSAVSMSKHTYSHILHISRHHIEKHSLMNVMYHHHSLSQLNSTQFMSWRHHEVLCTRQIIHWMKFSSAFFHFLTQNVCFVGWKKRKRQFLKSHLKSSQWTFNVMEKQSFTFFLLKKWWNCVLSSSE